ncbi:MAG: WXG100 family type VII secretion target [Solirubrobacterales bacterium]
MGQIRITPSTMLERSKEYLTEASNIENVIQKMDSLINELQGEWEGNASAQFANQYQELRPSFLNMQTLTETIAKQLQQTADAMEQMDLDISKQFGVK